MISSNLPESLTVIQGHQFTITATYPIANRSTTVSFANQNPSVNYGITYSVESCVVSANSPCTTVVTVANTVPSSTTESISIPQKIFKTQISDTNSVTLSQESIDFAVQFSGFTGAGNMVLTERDKTAFITGGTTSGYFSGPIFQCSVSGGTLYACGTAIGLEWIAQNYSYESGILSGVAINIYNNILYSVVVGLTPPFNPVAKFMACTVNGKSLSNCSFTDASSVFQNPTNIPEYNILSISGGYMYITTGIPAYPHQQMTVCSVNGTNISNCVTTTGDLGFSGGNSITLNSNNLYISSDLSTAGYGIIYSCPLTSESTVGNCSTISLSNPQYPSALAFTTFGSGNNYALVGSVNSGVGVCSSNLDPGVSPNVCTDNPNSLFAQITSMTINSNNSRLFVTNSSYQAETIVASCDISNLQISQSITSCESAGY